MMNILLFNPGMIHGAAIFTSSPGYSAGARRQRFGALPRTVRSHGKSVNPLASCAPPAATVRLDGDWSWRLAKVLELSCKCFFWMKVDLGNLLTFRPEASFLIC